jgi:hypothetical protein
MILGQEKPSLEELVHFGVKGMKWGVINEDKPTGRTSKGSADSSKPKTKASSDDAKTASYKRS